MDSDPSYTVYSIPAVPGQHHIVQYKDLRLHAVQNDPQCFSSTYEREISLSYEQWKARLHSRDKVTIISAASFQSTERLSWQHKWVGMLTVIGPKVLQKFGFKPPRSMQNPNKNYYLFMGVWVHPAHRGKCLGKKMIAAGIDWIIADDDGLDSEKEKSGVEQRTLLLQVAPNNQQAIGLYSSMGFSLIDIEPDTEDVNLWMGMELVS